MSDASHQASLIQPLNKKCDMLQANQEDTGLPMNVPAGNAIDNTAILVVRLRNDQDQTKSSLPSLDLEIAAFGEVGEVYVIGAGVAAGYHRRVAGPQCFAAPMTCMASILNCMVPVQIRFESSYCTNKQLPARLECSQRELTVRH